jgi:tetratricopeptide (TPR) repeat protein
VRPATPVAVLLLLAVSSSAAADTIVLKNGRRIVADNVTEDATHVTYQTPAGELSIPKSIVVRIERDNFGYSSASKAYSEAPVSAPQVEPVRGYEEVAGLAVHDNAIDFGYLSRLESDARSGTTPAIAKLAAAHHAAAQFLIGKGDIDPAIEQYRQALAYAPDNVGSAAERRRLFILRESQFTAALDPLERARRTGSQIPRTSPS